MSFTEIIPGISRNSCLQFDEEDSNFLREVTPANPSSILPKAYTSRTTILCSECFYNRISYLLLEPGCQARGDCNWSEINAILCFVDRIVARVEAIAQIPLRIFAQQ